MLSLNLSVAARIILGYALVLVMTAGILVCALFGLSSIHEKISSLAGKALPLTAQAGELASYLLQANIEIGRYRYAETESSLDVHEQIFQDLKESTEYSIEQLQAIIKTAPSAKLAFDTAISETENMFSIADIILQEHRDAVSISLSLVERKSLFSDLSDEAVSEAYNLAGNSDTVETLANTIDDIGISVLEGLNSEALGVVLGNRRTVEEAFSDFEGQLASYSGARSSSDLTILRKKLNKLKSEALGSGGLFEVHLSKLSHHKVVAEKANELSNVTQDAVDAITDLSYEVESITADIQTEAESTVGQTRSVILGFVFFAVLTSIAMALWVTQSIRGPLKIVVDMMSKVAGGDFTHSVNEDKFRKDELGELVAAMQTLSSRLRHTCKEIMDNSQQLATTAEETSTISHKSLETITHQREQADMIAASTEQMTATVEEVANSVIETQQQVERACEEIETGENILRQNIQKVTRLSKEIEESSHVISELNEYSNNIGSIMEVIRSVAEQTNLLALNAAIEAARAGEQGRGFAVVADEVRTLASRTHDSTEEINSMVERLQNTAEKAVKTMNVSCEEAQQTVEGITQVGEILAGITQSMNLIKNMSHQIAVASEEQSSTTQEQNRNISRIADFANDTSAAASQNQAASEELARMAEHQRSLVSQFKI